MHGRTPICLYSRQLASPWNSSPPDVWGLTSAFLCLELFRGKLLLRRGDVIRHGGSRGYGRFLRFPHGPPHIAAALFLRLCSHGSQRPPIYTKSTSPSQATHVPGPLTQPTLSQASAKSATQFQTRQLNYLGFRCK